MPSDPQPVRASRALLFPGPQPPLSHLGVTLQRHVVATGLRYAFYHLGLPLPERPPVTIVQLRLYLDAGRLRRDLEGVAGRRELIGALLEPGGSGRLPGAARRIAAAATLHRLRQRFTPHRRARSGPAPPPSGGSPRELWLALRSRLAARQPALNEALLGELLAALARRADRARGRRRPPCSSLESWRLRTGRPARLDRLGPADPLQPSWAETVSAAERARRLSTEPPPPCRARGRFRETYRRALDDLRPLYLALAGAARDRGWLERCDDAFFFPFDLAEDLAGERRPGWLQDAAAANRREFEGLQGVEGPPETLTGAPLTARPVESDWEMAPIAPLD